MTQRLRALFASLCLLLVISAFAQPTFSFQTINNAVTGGLVVHRLKVGGFTNIISAQFAVCWDPKVLRFESVSNLNLPNLRDSVHFSTSHIQEGVLGFAWPSPNIISGTSVPDGTNIFQINFTVLGPLNSGSVVKIADKFPTVIEIGQLVNGSITAIPNNTIIFQNGFVAVGYTVPTAEIAAHKMAVEVSPNPFHERTHVVFTVEKAMWLNWKIADNSGRILLKNEEFFQSGQHGMEIVSTQLRGVGTYFFIVETADSRIVRPIFLF
jgi:hypothetical protein